MKNNGYVSANGHSTKNAFDMFPRTDIAFDVLPVYSCHVETVCLLSNRKSKPDTHVDLTLDMEDYYRIKDQEKQSNK